MRSGSDFAPPVQDATDAILPAALSRAKLLRLTFHTLRHRCGSPTIASGAPITESQGAARPR